MKYIHFKNFIRDLPVFSPSNLLIPGENKQLLNNQIYQWRKKGFLIPLKKDLYVLNEYDRKVTPSREFIANQLVFPSYVSLEYALSFHGLIPEKVYEVTSITSKKTTRFINSFGTFSYHNVKKDVFGGFYSIKDENQMRIFIAEKEKALLDFLYIYLSEIQLEDPDFLENHYRMTNLDDLDLSLIEKYIQVYSSKKLKKSIETFLLKR
jgi:predicted transcriptional regulator of viral defense system